MLIITAKMRLVIPSNSSAKNFPQNTLAQFTVQLPQPIDLSKGRWEIGLSEIQFYKSWYNLTDAYISLEKHNSVLKVSLPDGYYATNEMLVNEMNNRMQQVFDNGVAEAIKFSYCEFNRSFQINLSKDNRDPLLGITVDFSKSLKAILNVDELKLRDDDDDTTIITSTKPMRLNSIFNLMVYTDAAISTVVGDTETPLLRAVPVDEGHWKYQATTFTKIQYIPVSQKELRTISIYIYTDYGDLVPFNDGKTIVTVDLRRADTLL